MLLNPNQEVTVVVRETPLPGRSVRGSESGRPIMALFDLLGRPWALRILWELRDDRVPTFRDLQERCGNLSSSVLAERLRELNEAGILDKDDGYGLTQQGAALATALGPLESWSTRWARSVAAE